MKLTNSPYPLTEQDKAFALFLMQGIRKKQGACQGIESGAPTSQPTSKTKNSHRSKFRD